jgi:YD repeat-containing protein
VNTVKLTNNFNTVYLWGYQNTLPIAEARGAESNEVFHTSFEDNGVENSSARTGTRVWSGTYQLSIPGVNNRYKVTYWRKVGTNPWEKMEVVITMTAGPAQTLTLGGSNTLLDEVRMHPIGAQMTTYTHDPQVGVTSVTDPNNKTTYYRYDSFGRLSFLVDDQGNLLKQYIYHYKGEY